MTQAYIVDAVRTPRGIGKKGKGALAYLHPQELCATVLRALVERQSLADGAVEDVIWGTSSQYGLQGADIGRLAALYAGLGIGSGGATIDRFCGASLTATNLAAGSLISGTDDLVVAGGCEMMSFTTDFGGRLREAGFGTNAYGGNRKLQDRYPQGHQGIAADFIAARIGATRAELDAYGVQSQRRAAVAINEGRFKNSIIPVVDDNGAVILARDEHPRPSTTLEALAQMKPAFGAFKDMPCGAGQPTFGELVAKVYPGIAFEPLHTAGTSSGMVDGAAALLLASDKGLEKHKLKPRARMVAMANYANDPTLMLGAPPGAITKVLSKAKLNKEDIDVFEINEAFASIVELCIREHDLDRAKVNPNGGAIAMGHPIGASGAILIGTALDELERSGGRYGLVTMCTAAGMAPAIIIERI